MNVSRSIWEFIHANKRATFFAFLAGLFARTFTLLLPVYIARSFEPLFGIASHRAQVLNFLPFLEKTDFVSYLLVFMGLILAKGLLDFAERYCISYLGERHLLYLRQKLFSHQLETEFLVYETKGTGRYLLRYSGDLGSIQALVSRGMLRFASDVILILAAVYVLFRMDPVMAYLICGSSLLIAATNFFINNLLYEASKKRRDAKSGLLSFVAHRLKAIATVKTLNRQSPEVHRFDKKAQKLFQLGKSYHAIHSLATALIPLELYLMMALVMLSFYLRPTRPEPSGYFMAILLLITMLPIFRRTFRVGIIWRNGLISMRKLVAVLDQPQESREISISLPDSPKSLQIDALHFSYAGGAVVFSDLNLLMKGNGVFFLQGDNQSGKSTLAKILGGLYLPDAGEILLNGCPVTELSPFVMRKYISVSSEENPLLGKTVFECISYSRKPNKRQEAQEMLTALGLAEVLPLDRPVGEAGSLLSSSERKWLILIRSFLTRKNIIILDDPFKNLDPQAGDTLSAFLMKMAPSCMILLLGRSMPDSLSAVLLGKISRSYRPQGSIASGFNP